MEIKVDQSVANRLAQKGITREVGVYGEHKVKLGAGSPVRLDKIKSASIPYQGFRTATKVERGSEGLVQSATATLTTLMKPGSLDAGKLLGALKTNMNYMARLDKLGKGSPDRQNGSLWAFAPFVETLSNTELAAIYQNMNSAEMTLLEAALARESQLKPNAADVQSARGQLFDLQALILKEMSNRVSNGLLDDLIDKEPNPEEKAKLDALRPKLLTEQYPSPLRASPFVPRAGDISSSNLHTMANVAAESATRREKTAAAEIGKMTRRGISATPREIGDLLRATELTINIGSNVFLYENSFIHNPDRPLPNIFHLADQDIRPKGELYLDQRETTEQLVFPELAGHGRRADERPVYGALNIQQAQQGPASRSYGESVIILKPEVARRATFIAEDTFYSPAMTITAERKENFFRLLNNSGINGGALDNLVAPDKGVHRLADQWFDKLAREGNLTSRAFDAPPAELGLEGDDTIRFITTCLKAFGDPSATRAKMATYDNLESLLPGLTDLNGSLLAEAAERRRATGGDSSLRLAMNYIEAQIQGPLIPSRDIQEIRVNIDSDEDARDELVANMLRFHAETGIPVVFISFDGTCLDALARRPEGLPEGVRLEADVSAEDDNRVIGNLADGARYFGEHIKAEAKAALETEKTHIQDHLRTLIKTYHLEDRFPTEGDVLPENSTMLGPLWSKTGSRLAEILKNPGYSDHTPQKLVARAIADTFLPMLRNKAAIVDKMATLPMTDAQRTAFTSWVMSSKVKTPDEFMMIYDTSQIQSAAFRKIAAAEEPMKPEEVFKTLADASKLVDARMAEYVAALPKDAEYGPDNKLADIDRTVSLGYSFAENAEQAMTQEQIQTLHARLNAPEIRSMFAQLDGVLTCAQQNSANGLHDKEGFGPLTMLQRLVGATYEHTDRKMRLRPNAPYFRLPVSFVSKRNRELFATVSAEAFIAELDRKYPPYADFPKAAAPDALPKTDAARRAFAVKHLDAYLRHETTFDKRAFHGRGHIARAYVYATAMCNFLRENDVLVDRNAVLCAVVGHDSGREGNGADQKAWEAKSGENTVDFMRADYGAESLGASYEEAVKSLIADHDGPTLEHVILQSADSLDYGRLFGAKLNPEYTNFMKPRTPDEKSRLGENFRTAIGRETVDFQILTNPQCALEETLMGLDARMQTTENDSERTVAQARKKAFERTMDDAFTAQRAMSSEDFFAMIENAIHSNRQIFKILNEYYPKTEGAHA